MRNVSSPRFFFREKKTGVGIDFFLILRFSNCESTENDYYKL